MPWLVLLTTAHNPVPPTCTSWPGFTATRATRLAMAGAAGTERPRVVVAKQAMPTRHRRHIDVLGVCLGPSTFRVDLPLGQAAAHTPPMMARTNAEHARPDAFTVDADAEPAGMGPVVSMTSSWPWPSYRPGALPTTAAAAWSACAEAA